MKDEFTAKMHSEFSVSPETEIKHRAGCVWQLLSWRNQIENEQAIREVSIMYGITYEQAMKWKDYWLKDT